MTPCPDENLLAAWATGACTADEATGVSAHVEECGACRAAFSAVVSTPLDVTHPRAGKLISNEATFAEGDVLLGKYRVEKELGAGGMGIVLRAKHLTLNSVVALKLIRPDLLGDADVVSRFAREARSAVRLRTQHVCRVIDLETLPNGQPMMVMEYLEGETLEARLARTKLTIGEVLTWAREALEGLAEAHALGIVHRDLKPANLFLHRGADTREVLKILDFGIAKSVHPDIELGLQQTSQRMLVGSPAFMSPEQLTPGATIDARTDVWSVGCTLYALLTGAPPFKGTDLVELAWEVRHAAIPPLPAHVPAALMACVTKCLEREPAKRFQSVAQLDAALAAVVVSESQRVPVAQPSRAPRFFVGVTLALVAAVGIGFWVFEMKGPAPAAAAPAPTAPALPAPALEKAVPQPPPLMVEPPPVPAPSEPLERTAPAQPAPAPSKRVTHARPHAGRSDAGSDADIFLDRR